MSPTPADLVYRWCRRFVARRDGNDNTDITTNGELRLLQRVMPTCRVVFDVGANVGDWAARVCEIRPEIALHCFEPDPDAFRRLSERPLRAAVVRNPFGLGSRPEQRTLFAFGTANGMNSLYRRSGLEACGIGAQTALPPVELRTLDAYCGDRGIDEIDFLKIDVEGHELEVLRGGSVLLERGGARLIQLEYGGCNIDARVFLKDLFEVTAPWPYGWHKILPRGLRAASAYSQQFEDFRYSNWLLVRRGEHIPG